jgi:uncharacterized membrane protein
VTGSPVSPSPTNTPANWEPHTAPSPKVSAADETSVEISSTGLPPRVAGVLCYAAAWLSGLVILAIERESRFVRFHAWQAVLGFGVLTLVALACSSATILMAFVSPDAFRVMARITQVGWVVFVAVWLLAIALVARGKRWKMPVVGKYAERLAVPTP